MLHFNNNHIFTGYLKQFLSSFNLPVCKVYTAEFKKYYSEHGYEDPRVIESNLPIPVSMKTRPAAGITYLKDGHAQQYFWDVSTWDVNEDISKNKVVKYWKSHKTLNYNGNRVVGLTKTLRNPTTLYNYQTHEYLGDYLRFLRDYENINLMSMYNCFSDRLCNNIKTKLEWKNADGDVTKTVIVDAHSRDYKIYALPVKLFENYTIAIDCYQGVELFCGFYTEKLDTSAKAEDLMKKTYVKIPKTIFNQPFLYDKLNVKYWNWFNENSVADSSSIMKDTTQILRSEIALQESELKLFIKIPATNKSSITILEGDYRNYNDSRYISNSNTGWQYRCNSTVANFETNKTYKGSTLPDINAREFKPISKLQLLALNTGISYPFADRLVEYLIANTVLPNDITPDNIKRLQKVMEDCGYSFQIDGVWEPKMQMILYDYLMNSGKFTVATKLDKDGEPIYHKDGTPVYKVENKRTGNLKQRSQKLQSECYDILGYVDKDAEKLYASWTVEINERTKKPQVVAKTTLENVDIYADLYNV